MYFSIFPAHYILLTFSVKMLKKDKNGTPDWLSKLPQMAKQLEVSLYRNAQSFKAYMDMTTLKHRLQMIAMEVSRKAKSSQPGGDRSSSSSSSQQGYPRGRESTSRNGSSSPYDPPPPSSTRHSSSSERPATTVKMDEINPMANSANSEMMRQSSGSAAYPPSRSPPVQSAFPGNRNDPEFKVRIRHKQQRLLLLHHAAKCPHNEGRCTTTPHCADMKRLWRHMEQCKDNNCRVSHCFSSRAILSHYRKCKDPHCPACGPVRDTVRKTYSKQPGSSQSGTPRDSMGRPSSSGPMMTAMLNQSYSSGVSSSSQRNPAIVSSPSPTGGPSGAFSAPSTSRQQSSSHSMPPPSGQGAMQYSSSAPYRSSSGGTPTSSASAQPPGYKKGDSRSPPPPQQPSPSSSSGHGSVPNGSSSSRRNDSEWQKVRHKQQRLLLLRHASKCQYEAGKCPVTPHCANMKKLWEHIAHCRNQQCTVQHCMSCSICFESLSTLQGPSMSSLWTCPLRRFVRVMTRTSRARRLDRGFPIPSNSFLYP